jgi:hypothetical protein
MCVVFAADAPNTESISQSETFRKNASNCSELAEAGKGPLQLRYKRMEQAWLALASEQDWLDGQVRPETNQG